MQGIYIMEPLLIIMIALHTGIFAWWIWIMERRVSKIETTTIDILQDQLKFLEYLYGAALMDKETVKKDG